MQIPNNVIVLVNDIYNYFRIKIKKLYEFIVLHLDY